MIARANALIALLHGVGSSAAAMEPVAARLREAIPSAAILALNAPWPFDQGQAGRQWFSLSGVDKTNRAQRISAALPALWSTLDDHLHDLRIDRTRLGLLGFSQGAMMALGAALDERPPSAVAAIAGRLAVEGPIRTGRRPEFFIAHGSRDTVVPPSCAREAAERLRAAGRTVFLEMTAGLDHSIAPAQVTRAAALFRHAFGHAEVA